MSVMYEKATFVSFIYMQPQKLEFKSVQINMNQVSYIGIRLKKVNILYVSYQF